jgi:hypothetical protein
VVELFGDLVAFWRGFQDASGAIIDPIEGYEIQYATPTYALTCASLVASNSSLRPSLLPSCLAALNSSIIDVSAGTAPQGHNNFFILPVMLAKRILAPFIPVATMSTFNATLGTLDPYSSYHGYLTNNWGLVAVAGEYLRVDEGLCKINCTWWEDELDLQIAESAFTDNGQYQDHTGEDGLNPLAYDLFARLYVSCLVSFGYDGKYSTLLTQVVERGTEMTALLQTPRGDIALGGRSQMHMWNQGGEYLLQTMRAADMVRAGNATKACQFRRSANLALESLLRWLSTPAEAGVNGTHAGACCSDESGVRGEDEVGEGERNVDVFRQSVLHHDVPRARSEPVWVFSVLVLEPVQPSTAGKARNCAPACS